MKRLCLMLIAFVVVLSTQAQAPKLVGHRGSLWGVENSKEAFVNGAKKGYHGLESDIKVTKDGRFVVCHDDNLKRFGFPEVKIADSTLKELKALTLKQVRNGVEYTANICTLEEYLVVCRKYKCFPVIELKWATGVNNNDMTNLPKLLNIVKDKGFEKKAVYISSMKPCLEFVRATQPKANIQVLTYDKTLLANLEWCIQNNVSVDMAKGPFVDASVVKQFHDAGLQVNVWTINEVSEYTQYLNYGVDYITTDSIELE